jgi:hypothetical protein
MTQARLWRGGRRGNFSGLRAIVFTRLSTPLSTKAEPGLEKTMDPKRPWTRKLGASAEAHPEPALKRPQGDIHPTQLQAFRLARRNCQDHPWPNAIAVRARHAALSFCGVVDLRCCRSEPDLAGAAKP